MKTYNFNICKYYITITIEKKPFKVAEKKSFNEKECPPDYNDVVCAYHDADCEACWDEYTSTFNKLTEEIKMEEESHNLCVLEAANKYIGSKVGELADSTRKGYMNIVDNHLSSIWLYRLDRLTEEHLQEAFDAEIAKGLSVKTLKGYRTFILKVLAEYRPDFHPNIRVTKEGVDETPKT